MEVGVLTLHNAFNFGAYLQAYALQKALIGMGHDVEFISLSGREASMRRIRTLLSKKPSKLVFNLRKYAAFRQAWKSINVNRTSYSKTRRHYDAVVIGSDEVWNIQNPTFAMMPEYFGRGLNAKNIITYAPSSSKTTYADVAQNPLLAEGMRNIHHFSARDRNTFEIVEKIVNKPVTMVLDPTFLVEYDEEVEEAGVNSHGYVLVYTYQFDRLKIEKTRRFARSRGLRLISPCFYNDWCDEVVPCTPFGFLGLIRDAEYVVTDTFHGSIFSILYGKHFGSYASEKIKVAALLSALGLADRELGGVDDIGSVLDARIDYGRVRTCIEQERDVSLNYLRQALAPAG
ncbi:polysaccharide pyruvyl transferase family protein [Thiobacillus denitrificans]|nr:polysaccharide pyruvyl transferase family protein [Thiobacillus denitrificans]